MRSGFGEDDDHVDEFGGGCVAPVVVLQGVQHRAHEFRAQELLGMVEAGLEQIGKVVMLGGAD